MALYFEDEIAEILIKVSSQNWKFICLYYSSGQVEMLLKALKMLAILLMQEN